MPTDERSLEELLREVDDQSLPDCKEIGVDDCIWCELTRRLKALDERHRKYSRETKTGIERCLCGAEWPCPDRDLLEGRNG